MRFLFVCIENSCRSQIAEAFARIHGGNDVEAFSGGSRPSGVVNPRAIASMKDVGYDLSTHTSKPVDSIPEGDFDYVVTMGCGDECPWIPAKHRYDWDIPDPGNMPPDEFAEVRNDIEQRVKALLAETNERR